MYQTTVEGKYAIFSSPDPKGHVRYCHHLASVVRPSVVRRTYLHVFGNNSKTVNNIRNLTR